MKILFLSHRVPYPPNKGEKIRAFNEIKYLSKSHEIHLLAFYDYPEEIQYKNNLEPFCESVTLIPLIRWKQYFRAGFAMVSGKPWSLGYFGNTLMKKTVSKKTADISPDLIFVYCSSMAAYVNHVSGTPKVLDFVDSDALKWKQYSQARKAPACWLYGYEAKKLLEFETEMVKAFDYSIFVSASEIAGHNLQPLRNKIVFVQNGIDLQLFKPSDTDNKEPAIAFTGAMDYYPNIDAVVHFAHKIFPKVRTVYPNARFFIIGSRPATVVQKLSSIPGITVTGTVKDVRPFLSRCRCAVVPLRIAQGIQNKILEALAIGLPVVATPIAAGELRAIKDLPLAIAEDSESFAKKVIGYMKQASLSNEAVDACRRSLKAHFDWTTNLDALDELINIAARESSPDRA